MIPLAIGACSFFNIFCGNGEVEGECASRAHFACHVDISVMVLDGAPDHGQSQARPASAHDFFRKKRLEYFVEVSLRYPCSRIRYF